MGVDAVMYLVTEKSYTEEEVLAFAVKLASAIGPENFFIMRPDNQFGWEPCHCLTVADEEDREYDDQLPEGKPVLRVHLGSRYYGPGYERGDIVTILAIADWLKTVIGGEVLYGGDAGDDLIRLDDEARRELWEHFCAVGHEPYRRGFSSMESDGVAPPPDCTLCKQPMTRFGYGKGYGKYTCHGCNATVETHDAGLSYEPAQLR